MRGVSVPFTSGSSLQLAGSHPGIQPGNVRFSSLYIGILAATWHTKNGVRYWEGFSSLYIGILAATILQQLGPAACASRFSSLYIGILAATLLASAQLIAPFSFSSLYIGILAATACQSPNLSLVIEFQFPLHRDPRCNYRLPGPCPR